MTKRIKIILISAIFLGVAVLLGFGIINWIQKYQDNQRLEEYRELYNNCLDQFEAENSTASDVDVVFIGDSWTAGYDVERYYPEYNVLNRGIGGDTTVWLQDRLEVSLYDANPLVVVLLIGGNNLDHCLDNYSQILADIQSHLPNAKVIIESLYPVGGSWSDRNEKIKQVNEQIEILANQYGYTFADVYPLMVDENGTYIPEYKTEDAVHLSEAGYDVVTSVLSPIIEGLLD